MTQPANGRSARPAKSRPSRSATRDWLTVDDILHELDIPRRTWQRWRTRKRVPKMHRLPNGEYRIRRADYESWLAGLEVDA